MSELRKAEWKQYKRKGLSEMRPYIKGEDLSHISVSETDDPETDMGMIARNPVNHNDQWYVARKYFEDNLEEALAAEQEQEPVGVVEKKDHMRDRRDGDVIWFQPAYSMMKHGDLLYIHTQSKDDQDAN